MPCPAVVSTSSACCSRSLTQSVRVCVLAAARSFMPQPAHWLLYNPMCLSQVVQEPVARWQDVNGVNMLEKFYADPKGMAYKFQHYVFITRADQVCEARRRLMQPHAAW